MIRYLAYYSFGGYKDMMLGTDEDQHETQYYSPFLQPWKFGNMKGLDERTVQQLEELDKLGQIEIIGQGSGYQMPKTARTLSSHGGYLLACCRLEDGTYSVAVRNIVNESKDEFGRPIPFMMQIVMDDVKKADRLTTYMRSHLEDAKKTLGALFSYNPNLNCLQFELSKANRFVEEAASKHDAELSTSRPVRTIVVSNSMNLGYCLKEIGFKREDVYEAYNEIGRRIYEEMVVAGDNNLSNQSDVNSDESLAHSLLKINTFNLTPEDKEDLQAIKSHVKNILNRHNKR